MPQPGLAEVSIPFHLTFKTADSNLRVGIDQKLQSRLYGSFLSRSSAAPHCLSNEPIINIDIGPHRVFVDV
jgi:hypothetical protein